MQPCYAGRMPEAFNQPDPETDPSLAGHDLDDDGDHDPDECYVCLHDQAKTSSCRCGKCCHLLIEVDARDAEREPKIAEYGSPIFADARTTQSGKEELIGFFLNTSMNDNACVFLDRDSGRCTIYETRPLICRLFDCDGDGREQMIELGLLPPRSE